MTKEKARIAVEVLQALSKESYIVADLDRNGSVEIFRHTPDYQLSLIPDAVMEQFQQAEELGDMVHIAKEFLQIKPDSDAESRKAQIQEMLAEDEDIKEIKFDQNGFTSVR